MKSDDQNSYLLFWAQKGLKARGLWDDQVYKDRVDYEWKVISRMGFAGYYLVVADYVAWARSQRIPVGPGRGSGAGSLIAYAVGITDVDPIKWGLMFERFLNPGRVSMPDFDIDFGKRDRLKVFDYLSEKYGHQNVCQIGTIGTMKAKLAVKDVGRTLGLDPSELERFSSLIPDEERGGQGDHAITLSLLLDPPRELVKAHGEALAKFRTAYEFDKDFHRVVNLAVELEGIPKSYGVHAAGVVIGIDSLWGDIPLRKSNDGRPVSQWTDKQVEKMGLAY